MECVGYISSIDNNTMKPLYAIHGSKEYVFNDITFDVTIQKNDILRLVNSQATNNLMQRYRNKCKHLYNELTHREIDCKALEDGLKQCMNDAVNGKEVGEEWQSNLVDNSLLVIQHQRRIKELKEKKNINIEYEEIIERKIIELYPCVPTKTFFLQNKIIWTPIKWQASSLNKMKHQSDTVTKNVDKIFKNPNGIKFEHKHPDINYNEKKNEIWTSATPSGWRSIFGRNLIAGSSTLEWHITINTYGGYNSWKCAVGIIHGSFEEWETQKYPGQSEDFPSQVFVFGTGNIYDKKSLKKYAKLNPPIKQGDIVTIQVDMILKTIRYFHNDKDLGIAFENIPTKCRLILSLAHDQHLTVVGNVI